MINKTILMLFFWIFVGLGLASLIAFVVWRHQHTALRGLLFPRRLQTPDPPGMRGFNGVELHACSTQAVMMPMVRHGLAEAKVRAGRGGVVGVEVCLALNHLSPTRSNRLQALPAELLLLIGESLDYGAALALSRTSRFFRDLSPADWISELDKLDYVLAAEGFKRNKRQRRLACFTCMRVCREKKFLRVYRTKHLARSGYWELLRKCNACCGRVRTAVGAVVEGVDG
ncbi:hypothetical protein LTR36_009020 [Oleoguttula mirabilis]|uniref:F-box domain-containing protein n=1 Tax=Oleoguttula mirabilis TaxID=1507867 RepID=A0AAV9J6Q5_9PEZI|nr:hypothetical protein LTR36_009020 [Oleoguttula mirabilis]